MERNSMKRTIAGLLAAAMMTASGPAFAGQVYGEYGTGGDPDAPYAGGGMVYQESPGPQPRRYAASEYTGCDRNRDREVFGTIVGGVIGGIIGNQFGRGRGRTAATAFGVVLGGIAGHAITRNNWCSDQQADAYYYNTAYYDAFDEPNYGEQYEWRNEYSGNYGYVTPVADTTWGEYQDCQQFQQVIYIDGQPQSANGVACRQADGSWRIVS
jgi:surface antigen